MKSNKGFTFYSRAYSLHTKRGFTLIELLVVIAIIGVLATIVIGSINTAQAKARDARREQDIKSIQTALQVYYMDHGNYPGTGWRHSGDLNWKTSLEVHLGDLPEDPINMPGGKAADGDFVYSYVSSSNDLFCKGQAYFIVYNKESSIPLVSSNGVALCNNHTYTYGDAFVVGVDKDGKLN